MNFKNSILKLSNDAVYSAVQNDKAIMLLQSILDAYGIVAINIETIGGGLINHTWKVTAADQSFVLQKINGDVFKNPHAIAQNIRLVADHLAASHPAYLFVAPVQTIEGKDLLYCLQEGVFRLLPFVAGSHTLHVVQSPEQAFEAAVQFGRFTRCLSGVDIKNLKTTIPLFHNLKLRYQQFLSAIEKAAPQRKTQAAHLIKYLLSQSDIVKVYAAICKNAHFKKRVTHHDTKISNVLFDACGKGLCVIDLDTMMPGYFISDVGDMMRTYLAPVSEEETDLKKIEVRNDFYRAVVSGYMQQMSSELTPAEINAFFYAGKFMIYMQAIRFLTDYLSGDVYYVAQYPNHNLNRAANQATLLQRLMEKESDLNKI